MLPFMSREHVAHLYSRVSFDVESLLTGFMCVFFSVIFYIFFFASLAVHPDKITIATGQVAGTSSDGKVSERD